MPNRPIYPVSTEFRTGDGEREGWVNVYENGLDKWGWPTRAIAETARIVDRNCGRAPCVYRLHVKWKSLG